MMRTIAATALLAVLPVATVAKTTESCVIGAAVKAVKEPERLRIFPPGADEAMTDVRPGTPLLPGTLIEFDSEAPRGSLTLVVEFDTDKVEELPKRSHLKRGYRVKGEECPPDSAVRIFNFLSSFIVAVGHTFVPGRMPPDSVYLGPKRSGDASVNPDITVDFKRLGPGPYLVTADHPHVFAAWTGRVGTLVLLDPDTGEEVSRGLVDGYGRSTTQLPPDSEGRAFDLVVEDDLGRMSPRLRIEVVAPGSAPAPPPELAEAPEAMRAAWLLVRGPEAWKLDALATLEVHRYTDPVALWAWRQAVTDAPLAR